MSEQELYEHRCKLGLQWSWTLAWLGVWKDYVVNPSFWVFIIFTLEFHRRETYDVWAYVVVCSCFMFHKPISKLIETAKMTVEAKFGASLNKNINKEEKL